MPTYLSSLGAETGKEVLADASTRIDLDMSIATVLLLTVALEEEVTVGHVVRCQVMREKALVDFALAVKKSR